MPTTSYEDDVIAWAARQAALLRAGRWELLDIDNIAEEIEDVGKSEKRELQSRYVVLVTHLLKWKYQPGRRGHSWRNTIKEQRAAIVDDLARHPHLKPLLNHPQWLMQIYRRGKLDAEMQTHLQDLPDDMPWDAGQLLSQDFLPE
ncbi:DUF29 domain-containing protein [Duganella aceris]|uniref:DUF29 domain-containing protein n=1 Tax=Duganella aceris TaxID=2703883 RepID=A0ABX0FM19_9BURK|nr:DUF29 domain-containing protein [Duganella aceris]NGZ85489.1 DUF29 domain-containing protein [Duganella aceris]